MADKVVREKTKIPSIYFNKSTGKYDVKYNYRDDVYCVSQALGHNRLDVTIAHYLK